MKSPLGNVRLVRLSLLLVAAAGLSACVTPGYYGGGIYNNGYAGYYAPYYGSYYYGGPVYNPFYEGFYGGYYAPFYYGGRHGRYGGNRHAWHGAPARGHAGMHAVGGRSHAGGAFHGNVGHGGFHGRSHH